MNYGQESPPPQKQNCEWTANDQMKRIFDWLYGELPVDDIRQHNKELENEQHDVKSVKQLHDRPAGFTPKHKAAHQERATRRKRRDQEQLRDQVSIPKRTRLYCPK